MNQRVQMIIDIAEFTSKELFFIIQPLSIITVLKYYRFYDKTFPWQPQMHGQALYNHY